jgi:hypothetical protein
MDEPKTVPLVVYVDGKRTVLGEATVTREGEVSCRVTTDLGRQLLDPSRDLEHYSISLEVPEFDDPDEVAVIKPVPARPAHRPLPLNEQLTQGELEHIAEFLRSYNDGRT